MTGSDRSERRQSPRIPERCSVAFRPIREGGASRKTTAAQTKKGRGKASKSSAGAAGS